MGVSAVKDLLEPGARRVGGGAANDGNEFAARTREPLQPLQCHEAAEVAIGAGEQNGVRLTGGAWQRLGRSQRLCVDELLERQIACINSGFALPMDRGEGRSGR